MDLGGQPGVGSPNALSESAGGAIGAHPWAPVLRSNPPATPSDPDGVTETWGSGWFFSSGGPDG